MQIALTIIGAVIGNAIGGPVGGAIGASLGSALGSYLAQEDITGPKLNDLHIQGSSYGTPVARVWGTFRLGGNLNWRVPELIEHEHDSSGGKGGPTVTTTSYSATYSVKICQGAHFLLGIWSNGRWIYDNRIGAPVATTDLPMVFYDGNDTQLPDPTEESVEGAGNVPAYLGYQRVVYTDRDVSEFGNVIPQDNYLVSSEGESSLPMQRIEGPWDPVVLDYRSSISWDVVDTTLIKSGRFYGDGSPGNPTYQTLGGFGTWYEDHWTVDGEHVETFLTVTLPAVGVDGSAGTAWKCQQDAQVLYLLMGDGAGHQAGVFYRSGVAITSEVYDLAGAPGDTFLGFLVDRDTFTLLDDVQGQRAYYLLHQSGAAHPDGSSICTVRRVFGLMPSITDPRVVLATTTDGETGKIWRNNQNNTLWVGRGAFGWYKYDEDLTLVHHYTWPGGTPQMEGSNVHGTGSVARPDGFFCSDAEGNEYCAYFGGHSGGYDRVFIAAVQDVTPWPIVTSIDYTTGSLGVFDLGDGVGFLQDGLIAVCQREQGSTLLSIICADVCELSGRTSGEYDVSRIPIPVRGFAACTEGPTAGRAILEAILPAFHVGVAEYNGQLVFLPRARPADVEVPDEDLAARSENGEPPVKLAITLGNDLEIPQQIFLKYFEPAMDYQIGTQEHHRQNTDSRVVKTVSVPVVFTAKEAKRVVESWLELALVEADAYSWTTTKKYLRYVPENIMRIQGIDIRITKKSVRMADGIIEWEGVRSHPGVFAQPGIGGDADGFVPPEIVEPQETELALLDIPLPEPSRQSIVWVAAQGADRVSWKGMSLQKSVDGGTNYSEALIDLVHDTIGETLTLLPNYGGPRSFDESTILDVLIHPGGGELASATRRAVFEGANRAMVGAEMIAYRDAELVDERTYRLTGLLRGLHGTGWAMRGHAIGDRVCLLPTNMIMDGLTSDLGATRKYKPVTLGSSLASATAQDFRFNGIALAPLAPVQLAAGFVGDPGSSDILFSWRRRTRFPAGWLNARAPTGKDSQPLGETSEAYRLRLFTDGTRLTVAGMLNATTTQRLYTQAEQTAHFGAPLTVRPTWGVAQIGALGPGYEAPLGHLPLFVPSTVPGYTPPYPPPAEAIDDVMPWTEATTINSGTFGPNDAWIIQTTTGNVDSGAGGLVRLQAAEFSGPPVQREATLSLIPGDFGPQAMPGAMTSGTPSVTMLFVVGSGDDFGFYPTFPQNTTIYLNIRCLPHSEPDAPMFCTLLNIP